MKPAKECVSHQAILMWVHMNVHNINETGTLHSTNLALQCGIKENKKKEHVQNEFMKGNLFKESHCTSLMHDRYFGKYTEGSFAAATSVTDWGESQEEETESEKLTGIH